MTQKVDAAQWTGLSPEQAYSDVRAAQNPVANPQELGPKTYHKRLINWSDMLVLIPIGIPVAAILGASTSEFVKIAIILLAATILPSVFKWFLRKRQGNPPAVKLDEAGLHLPYAFEGPIAWSKVGAISFTYGPAVGWISVVLDPEHKAKRKLPWPLRGTSDHNQNSTRQLEIISCWDTRANGAEFIASLEKYRDNYCAV